MTGNIVDRLESLADHGAASMEQAQEIASDALLEIRRLQGIEIIDRKSTQIGPPARVNRRYAAWRLKMENKFVTPCVLPSAREREILTILIEECAEVQQRATKLLRFGRDEVQPGQPLSNMERLSQEFGDLQAIATMAEDAGLVSRDIAGKQAPIKFEKLERFMQTSANG